MFAFGCGTAGVLDLPDDGDSSLGPPGSLEGCSEVGVELIRLVNAYRNDNGLRDVPASPSLCTVASIHTRDLSENAPHANPDCNLHSWSDQGSWSACCYTADHAQGECMWRKPRELTVYPGSGYENAAGGVGSPAAALSGWQRSSGHNAVILNEGIWARQAWRAVGADVFGGYAVLWFGSEADPAAL